MKYRFCSIYINVTKHDVTFATKRRSLISNPPPTPVCHIKGDRTKWREGVQTIAVRNIGGGQNRIKIGIIIIIMSYIKAEMCNEWAGAALRGFQVESRWWSSLWLSSMINMTVLNERTASRLIIWRFIFSSNWN